MCCAQREGDPLVWIPPRNGNPLLHIHNKNQQQATHSHTLRHTKFVNVLSLLGGGLDSAVPSLSSGASVFTSRKSRGAMSPVLNALQNLQTPPPPLSKIGSSSSI
uniref:(northern house mosquito) hypothetical protein n=1 Tax=Culex pipiens TaxID=7175 RepID=A0A8D8AWK2_CULPI